MTGEDDLPPEQLLALAYSHREHRPTIEAVLRLDRNFGRTVAHASEPIVGQLRLAWWRDALTAAPDRRPQGNPALDKLAALLGENLGQLVALVDGWESIMLAERLEESTLEPFLQGRTKAWQVIAEGVGAKADIERLDSAARTWALGDLIAGLESEGERKACLKIGRPNDGPIRLTRAMRPLSVLAALSRRAIQQGGAPLLADRVAALVALRSGLFGR